MNAGRLAISSPTIPTTGPPSTTAPLYPEPAAEHHQCVGPDGGHSGTSPAGGLADGVKYGILIGGGMT